MRESHRVRIALDVTPTARPQSTGIGRYARHLALALAETLSAEDELSLCTRISRWQARDLRVRHPRARNRWFQAPWGPAGRPHAMVMTLIRRARHHVRSQLLDSRTKNEPIMKMNNPLMARNCQSTV